MKKLMALALVFALMLGALPGAAFADDGVESSAPASEAPATPEEIVPLLACIETEEIPMANAGSWALVNLIAAALSVLIAAALVLSRRRQEDEEDSPPAAVKACSVLAAVASVVLFVITGNMHLRMVLTDRWTPVMLALFALSAVLAMAGSGKEEKEAA